MAALRNLAISAVRLAGRSDVTEATRWASDETNGRNVAIGSVTGATFGSSAFKCKRPLASTATVTLKFGTTPHVHCQLLPLTIHVGR